MAVKYIDADKFLLDNDYFADRDFINPRYSTTLRDLVDDAPAADVEPKRKTGTWTEENVYFDSYAWRCSVCKEDWNIIEGTPFENNMRFCPKCGAEMIAEVPKGEEDAD